MHLLQFHEKSIWLPRWTVQTWSEIYWMMSQQTSAYIIIVIVAEAIVGSSLVTIEVGAAEGTAVQGGKQPLTIR